MTRTLTASTIPLALAAVTEVAPTVAGVCDRLASQKDATTAATYRARLRPVIAAYGALQAPAALRRLTELETELCSVLGENAAHKAVTLLRAALRDAGFDLLTLVDAAAITGIAIPSLRALVDRGKVCCRDRRRHGRGESMLFDAVELASDLAALDLCPQPGCDKLGIGPSGYCGDHFAQGGRQGAARKERRLLGGKRDWYTVDEAARRLDESRTAITSRCARGELPSEKIGRHRRIPQEAVEQLRKARVGRRTKPKPTAEERDAQRQRVREFWEQPAYNGKPRAIANELDCSKPTVHARLDELGLDRPGKDRHSGRLSPELHAAREQRAVELYLAGYSIDATATKLELEGIPASPTQVRQDLINSRVERRPKARPAKYPQPSERACLRCGSRFTPRFPAFDTRRGQIAPRRYCSDECARLARREAIREALASRDLLGVTQAAARLGVGERRVYLLLARGLLVGEIVRLPGQLHAWGIRENELARFERDWVRGPGSGDGRRRLWLDPDRAVEQLERMGVIDRKAQREGRSVAVVRILERARLAERAKRLNGRKRGRKRSDGPPAFHFAWQERYDKLEEELLAGHAEDPAGALAPRPARRQICAAVAESDWLHHPERWSRQDWPADRWDPDGLDSRLQHAAGDRVRKALDRLKRLQNAGTGKTTA